MQFFSPLTHAWRSWKNSKSVALLAIAALAVGIGSTTAIYTVVDAVLLRPLPFAHGERYVSLFSAQKGQPGISSTSWLNLLEYQRRTTSFDSFGIYQPREFTLTAPGEPRHLTAVEVTPSFMRDLGVSLVTGSWFESSDAPNRAVISSELWRRLGSDPSLVGKTLTLDRATYTVTGIAPIWFRFPVAGTSGEEIRADLWVALNPQGSDRDRGVASFFANARMKPDVTPAQADADVKRAATQIAAEFMHDSGYTALAQSLRDDIAKDIRPTLLLLLAAAASLFLIACSNVAGLMLARSVARAREIAVRVALGAARSQLALQFFTEGLLIAIAGALLGVGVSIALVRFVLAIGAEWIPRADEIGVNAEALLFAGVVGILSCLLFSLAPLWQASRTMPNETLSDGARSSAGARSQGLSRSLVVAEIALVFMLLSVGAVLVENLNRLLNTSPGFDTHNLLTFSLNLGLPEYPTKEIRDAYQKRLIAAMQASPGVESAALVNHLPLDGCCFTTTLTPRDRTPNPVNDQVSFVAASAGYPRTLRLPIVSGRFVTDADGKEDPIGVAINQAAANRLWPGRNPVGSFARISGSATARIVGVGGNIKNDGLGAETKPEVYLISSVTIVNPLEFVVRSRLAPAALVPSLRRAVLSVDPSQAFYRFRTEDSIVLDGLGSDRLRSWLIVFFAASALLMAALGVYGVVSYSVRSRTVELGTRMALGAVRSNVLKLVLGGGLRMTAWGIAIGGVAVAGAALLLRSEVFGIAIGSPLPFLDAAAIVVGFATLATAFPAWRATLVSPMTAIRDNAESLWTSLRWRKPAIEVDIDEGVLLAEFVEASRVAVSFREAIARALVKVQGVMNASSAVVLEKDGTRGFSPSPNNADFIIPADGILAGRLAHYPFPLPLTEGDYEAWNRASDRHGAETAALQSNHIALVVPLLAKNELAGLLLLGERLDHNPYTRPQKRVLRNCAGQFALMIESARLTDRIVDQEKLRRDVQLASEVQKRLLPDKAPASDGFSLAGYSIPARGVGGDYYDFLDLGNQRIGIALADVAGKGVAAALIMSVVQASLRIIASEDIPLADLAAKMNRYLHRSTKSNGYATFFYALLDERHRRLRYVNAGHNPPFLLKCSAVHELPAGGTVIGLFPQSSYEEASIDLAPGDVLIAFTDGVPEALNPAEEEFGEDRVREMLRRWAHLDVDTMAQNIAGELKAWIADADQYDDLTFILLKSTQCA